MILGQIHTILAFPNTRCLLLQNYIFSLQKFQLTFLTKIPLFTPFLSSVLGKIPSFSRQFWVIFTQFGVFLIKALLYYKITYFPCTNSCFGFDQNPPYLPHFILPFLVKFRFSLRDFGSNSHNFGFFYYGFSSPTT